MIGPLKQYLKAPTMGTIFGIQEAANAPEGQKAKAFAKGAGTGVLYSLSTPGGHLGLNEMRENIKPYTETAKMILGNERGSIEIEKGKGLFSTSKKIIDNERGSIEIERNSGQKNPWEMTKEEFNKEYVFHGSPYEFSEIKEGSYFSDFNYAKGYAKKPGLPPGSGKIYAVRRSDIEPIGASKNDIFGQSEIETGASIRSGKSHNVIEVSSFNPHKKIVIDAISSGKQVPLNVLKEYPDLKNKQTEPTGQRRPRKFLKTIEEAAETEPDLVEKVKEIDPNDYLIQPNEQSLNLADARIKEKGLSETVDYALSDVPVSAEKGATFIKLIDEFQKAGDYDRASSMIEAYDTQLRESGRFIQAASLWSKGTPQSFIRWANKQLESVRDKYGWADTIIGRKPESFTLSREDQKYIMESYKEMDGLSGKDKADRTLELIDYVAKKVPPSVSELIDAYRYQNMLSSPKTHMRNIGENAFNTFVTAPADIATKGAVDFIKAGLFGKERQAYVLDAPLYLKSAINSLPNAMKAFKQTIKLGPGATLEKPDLGVESKNAFQSSRSNQIPVSLTMVSRFMEACDKFNSAVIAGGEMARLKKAGWNDLDAYKKANETAEGYLYRSKLDAGSSEISYPSKVLASLGQLMQESRRLPVLGKISKWYVPFLRTPINKGIQMVEKSPLGLVRGNLDQKAAANILLGSIVTGLGAIAAYEGETTWSAPSNEDEKKLFYESGRKPFSVKMGDRWVPIWYLGPFALAFAIPMAAKYYTEDSPSAMVDDGPDKLLAISEALAQFIGSQTSTPSISAFFSAADGDIDYKFSSQTGFTVQQMIPASSLIRYVNTILDPVYRHPKGFIENIEANIPGLSQNIEPRLTTMFEESRRDPINNFLPYDVGKTDENAELILPIKSFEIRQKKIKQKMDKITNDLKNGSITPEESMEKMFKLLQAPQKNIVKFSEDIEKQFGNLNKEK